MSTTDFSNIPSIPLPANQEHEYEVVPAWTVVARCISIIDLWTQEDSYQWEKKNVRKISVKFVSVKTYKSKSNEMFLRYQELFKDVDCTTYSNKLSSKNFWSVFILW